MLIRAATYTDADAGARALTQPGRVADDGVDQGAARRVVKPTRWRYNCDMKRREFVWPEDRIDHIALYETCPEGVEDVCFGDARVRRAKMDMTRVASWVWMWPHAGGDVCYR